MTKITELPAASQLADADPLSGVDISDTTEAPTGTTKKISLSLLRTWLSGTFMQRAAYDPPGETIVDASRYMQVVATNNAGAAITAGQMVALSESSKTYSITALANASTKVFARGMAAEGIAESATGRVFLEGVVPRDMTGLGAVNAPVYLGDAGALSTVPVPTAGPFQQVGFVASIGASGSLALMLGPQQAPEYVVANLTAATVANLTDLLGGDQAGDARSISITLVRNLFETALRAIAVGTVQTPPTAGEITAAGLILGEGGVQVRVGGTNYPVLNPAEPAQINGDIGYDLGANTAITAPDTVVPSPRAGAVRTVSGTGTLNVNAMTERGVVTYSLGGNVTVSLTGYTLHPDNSDPGTPNARFLTVGWDGVGTQRAVFW